MLKVSRILLYIFFCSVFLNIVAAEDFSFAVIADPHIDGNPEHTAKFESAVNWIIENKADTGIELVFVAGDIGWFHTDGKSNLAAARDILDRLTENGIEYVPVIGDNEVQTFQQEEFGRIFEANLDHLAKTLSNFETSISHINKNIYYNYSFDYKGCHFVCCDFVSREKGSEAGNLNDFPGGSWEWFKRDIENCPKDKKENIVIITHIGMFRTGIPFADKYLFDERQMKKIKNFTADYSEHIAADYAGHIHQNWHHNVSSGLFNSLYDVWTTDETWSDKRFPEIFDREGTVRWVEVSHKDEKIEYTQHIH